jgi:hypothetical protein
VSLEGPQQAAAALIGAQHSAARRIPKLDRIARDGSKRFRGLPSLFPISSLAELRGSPVLTRIDGAARGRKIDIYFLLIRIQARSRFSASGLLPMNASLRPRNVTRPFGDRSSANRCGAAGVQLKEADAAKRFGKALFRFATLVTP